MAINDPDGWKQAKCNFCGITKPHILYISIAIYTGDTESQYPYSQTDMCEECWNEYGIEAAIEHNIQCRIDAGTYKGEQSESE